jgi:hypothetical protein
LYYLYIMTEAFGPDGTAHPLSVYEPDSQLWCAETQPPVEILFDRRDEVAHVRIFAPGYNPHVGEIAEPVAREQVLHEADREITPELVQRDALNALAAHIQQRGDR